MIALFAVQFALPMVLIGGLTLVPPRTRFGFWIQFIAFAAALWAMALLGIWLLPPWWAPPAFGVALLLAAWRGLRRRRPFVSSMPVAWGGWLVAGLFVVGGVVSAGGIAIALRSRNLPPASAVRLAFPLERGVYLVVNGGSDINTNAHLMTLDARIPRFREWRGQSYGVDIVKLDAFGLRARGVLPVDPNVLTPSTAPVCLRPALARCCLPWTACPTCRFPRSTVRTWRATT